MFTCRYGEVMPDEMACTLVDTFATFNSPLAGKRLTRTEALEHPRLNEFWNIVDYLLENDHAIHDYFHHPLKSWIQLLLKR